MLNGLSASFKLLMVTPRFFPYSGGVENHVYQVAKRLVAKGVDLTVVSCDPTGKLKERDEIEGIQVWRVKAWPEKKDLYFAPHIFRLISQGGWDLIHLQSYHTFVAPLTMLAACRAKIPYLVTFHGGGHSSIVRNLLRGVQIQALKPLLILSRKLVVTAPFELERYAQPLGIERWARFTLVPNGADLLAARLDLPEPLSKKLVIASVGRLERYKGHHRILAAMPEILKSYPTLKLWIVGNGSYKAALERQVRKLNLLEQVEFKEVPPTDQEGMARLLSGVSLVTLLSEFESHPLSVLEALSLKRPVLVADNSGLHDMAQAGLVTAIPLKSSPYQIARAVVEQLEQPFLPENFELPTWNECSARLLELYQEILADVSPFSASNVMVTR